jgi:hypothetical protein
VGGGGGLVEALSRADRGALAHHLVRLMQHIIKWKVQPERRSRSWVATIHNAREAIRELQEDTPSLTDDRIRHRWDTCLRKAHLEAEGEIDRDTPKWAFPGRRYSRQHTLLTPTKLASMKAS